MYLFIIYFKQYLTSCNQNIVHFLIENTVYSKIFTPIYFDPFVLVSVCEFNTGRIPIFKQSYVWANFRNKKRRKNSKYSKQIYKIKYPFLNNKLMFKKSFKDPYDKVWCSISPSRTVNVNFKYMYTGCYSLTAIDFYQQKKEPTTNIWS